MWSLKWFTTVFGIGQIGKGGGTIAALLVCLIWFFVNPGTEYLGTEIAIVLIITAAAVWASGKLESEWGKDSSRIVIDEVVGMAVALLGFGMTWPRILLAFAFFRFFDIAKPLFIRRLERLPGGWGVMTDDLLAGLYSNIILQCLVAADRI